LQQGHVFSLGIDMNAPTRRSHLHRHEPRGEFRAAMLDKAGAEVVSNADVAIGN